MMFMWIVEDGGGGDGDYGGGGDGDYDFLIDDPMPKEPEPTLKVEDKPPLKASLDDETQKEIDELKEFKNGVAVEKAISSAVEMIKGDYPDFDIEKVSSLLKEMQDKDPAKVQLYNTPAGWEALHLKHFAAREEDGTFDPGRNNADEPYEFDKTRKEALGGDKKAMKKLFDNAK